MNFHVRTIIAGAFTLAVFSLCFWWEISTSGDDPSSSDPGTWKQPPNDHQDPCSVSGSHSKRLDELTNSDLLCILALENVPHAVLKLVEAGRFAGEHFAKVTFFDDMFASIPLQKFSPKHLLSLHSALPQLQRLHACLMATKKGRLGERLRLCKRSEDNAARQRRRSLAPTQTEFPKGAFASLKGLNIHRTSNAHGWIDGNLLDGRRNGMCIVTNQTGQQELISIGGRHAPNVESWNLETGEQKILTARGARTRNLLYKHHTHGVLVAPISGNSRRPSEFWIVCGLGVDEEALEKMTIISLTDWSVREGPSLDVARGSCSSFTLDRPLAWMQPLAPANVAPRSLARLDRTTRIDGRLVCVVGGTEHHEKNSHLTDSCSCYDRLSQQWLKLPSLREPQHHLSTVLVPSGVCNPTDPPRLLLWNGRNGDGFGPTTNKLLELRLHDEEPGEWIYRDGAPTLVSAAAQTLTRGGRYAVLFGGNGYTQERDVYMTSATVVYDICGHRACRATLSALRFVKWAIVGCTTADDKELLICGGDSTQDPDKALNGNTRSCDVFDLENLVQECEDARNTTGGGWQKVSRVSAKEMLRQSLPHDMPKFTELYNRTKVITQLDLEVR